MDRQYGLLTKQGMVWLQAEEIQLPVDSGRTFGSPMGTELETSCRLPTGDETDGQTDGGELTTQFFPAQPESLVFGSLEDQVLSMGTCEVDGSQQDEVSSDNIITDSFSSISLQESLDVFLSSPFFTSLSASIQKDPDFGLFTTPIQPEQTNNPFTFPITQSYSVNPNSDVSSVYSDANSHLPPITQLCRIDSTCFTCSSAVTPSDTVALMHPAQTVLQSHEKSHEANEEAQHSSTNKPKKKKKTERASTVKRKARIAPLSQTGRKFGMTAWQIAKKNKNRGPEKDAGSVRRKQEDGKWVRRAYSVIEKIKFVDMFRRELQKATVPLADFCERHRLNDKGMRTWMR
ncbi:hypothetical protein RvY_05339-2 [Ramazzottius varieornatus]|nr:hypothetical protein RvY_05339-2 [Ramazzottius varieornatus]